MNNKPLVFQASDWDWLKGIDKKEKTIIRPIQNIECKNCKEMEERLITLIKRLESINEL